MNIKILNQSVKNEINLSFFEKCCIAFIFAMLLYKITFSIYSHMMHYTMNKFPDLYTEQALNKFGYTKE